MAGQLSGLSVAYVTGGLVLLWSGMQNLPVAQTLKGFLSGQIPHGTPAGPIQVGVSDNSTEDSSSAATGIAGIAESYVGKLAYVYGGPPPAGTVDCSSFASKVLNQAGISNPGGAAYNPDTHGPTTLSYLSWSGAETVGNSASAAQANDLVVWQTHMGIATGDGNMVSALNEKLGVEQTTISGGAPPGEILFVRRLK